MSLFVVLGLAGIGKHTVCVTVAEQISRSPGYIFTPVLTTKDASAVRGLEQSIAEQEFKAVKTDPLKLVTWKDKGKEFAIGPAALKALQEGLKVITIVPLAQLETVQQAVTAHAPDATVNFISLSCKEDILAERRSKSKEEAKKLGKLLKKHQDKYTSQLPSQNILEVPNDGPVEETSALFLKALGFDPKLDIPPPDENDLKNCLPQDYLKRVIFPYLAPGLALLDKVRPDDPVGWLALYLVKESSETNELVAELNKAKTIRQDLRKEMAREFNVPGRV